MTVPQRDVFYHVMSDDTVRNTLTEEEREQLERLVPTQEGIQKEEVIRSAWRSLASPPGFPRGKRDMPSSLGIRRFLLFSLD